MTSPTALAPSYAMLMHEEERCQRMTVPEKQTATAIAIGLQGVGRGQNRRKVEC